MEEATLLKISLSASLVGLAVLLILTSRLQPGDTTIANLSAIEEGKAVRIEGVVQSMRDSGKVLSLQIAQPQTVEVVVFKENNISIQKGDFVDISGELRDYQGRKEILASRINLIE
jgi:DNA/RNA endonuclease YhcR with UshA esterase domain